MNANRAGFEHNRKQMLDFLPGHRNRTERLMNVLRSIQGLDVGNARLLCVGPRNEAEILLLRLYGFQRQHIQAVDLFSYAPSITLMDMNNLLYPDNYFDVYYSSFAIRYSPDMNKTIAEAVRVTKPGGLMAVGYTYGTASDVVPDGSNLLGGNEELLDLFGESVNQVFWNEEFHYAPGDIRSTCIFSINKIHAVDEAS